MEIFIIILILLIGIVLSNIISRLIPFFPVPLVQIIMGIILAVLPTGMHIPLEPELFMVLFIAPLIYNDGKRISRDELWKIRIPIVLMAFGLVFVSVIVVGYIINLMIPEIPLSACFALAAILSPTDAVTVSSLSQRIHLPKEITILLEGEALMNDASGLVAFKFAVAATVTGSFSITSAAASFFMMAVGGFFFGALISFVIVKLGASIRRLGLEDATFHVLMQLITPFIIYLASEEIGVSGILAVVSGGIVQSIESDYSEPMISKLKLVSKSTWSVLLFIVNGLVFLILGLQIPKVVEVVFNNTAISNFKVFIYIIAISLSLVLIRFIWVYAFWNEKWDEKHEKGNKKEKFMQCILTSLSGARGAVTLSAALSIPFYLGGGRLFPQRDLIIFLAAGVMLFSIIIASFVLPILVKTGDEDEKINSDKANQQALNSIVNSAIDLIKEEMNHENREAAIFLISNYEKIRNNALEQGEEFNLTVQDRKMERDIFAIGLKAEHEEIRRLAEERKCSMYTMEKIEQFINTIEEHLSKPMILQILDKVAYLKKFLKRFIYKKLRTECINIEEIKAIKILTSKAAIKAIKAQINEENKKASLDVINHYNEIIRKLDKNKAINNNQNVNKYKTDLQFKAFQAQRNHIQSLIENNIITRETANKLKQFINYMEATAIEEELY
ncbi:Na+/H+ antiporter [Clostridium sp. 19966]|uniref:Na+/H+ antiporter n=1 Tax=Clostridium sp. 19966 TaxID=2768166 RepID=UPI0028DEE2A6|nr:Na+/H+ antiporter [Clostridium sp. 19966]MDT8715146.1 Na+/H+ antiporter [Clostridium sp. 19966]